MNTRKERRRKKRISAFNQKNSLYYTDLHQTNRMILAMILVLVILIAFVFFTLMFRPSTKDVSINNGVIDLSRFNFDSANAKLPLTWEYYPGELYGPEDFAHKNTGKPRQFLSSDRSAYQTGTYRAVLLMEHQAIDALYGMYARSLDYSTRIFVDGKEALHVGEVFADAQDFRPRVRYYTLPIMPGDTSIEIIIQYTNYAYPEGGDMQEIVFGLFESVNRYAQNTQYTIMMLGAALLIVALFYLMLFIGGRGFPNFAFALCCFYLATRSQLFVLSLMPLDCLWSPVFRFLFINNICTGMAILLLVNSLYPTLLPERFKKIMVKGTVIVTLTLGVLAILLSPYQVALMARPSYLIFIPTIIYICWAVGKLIVQGRTIDRVNAVGIAFLFITLTLEMIIQRPIASELLLEFSITDAIRIGLLPSAMLTFAISQMLTLSFENAELSRLNRLKTEFLQNMSHELKTPLAVISTDILNAADQLEYEMDKGDIRASLKNAQDEIMRMSRMVNNAMEYPETQQSGEKKEPLDIAPLLRFSAETYQSMAKKKNNTLILDVPVSLPLVYANSDMIIQVLSNLLSNANRHTQDGEITIRAAEGSELVVVTVMDNGEGIKADLLPHIFERGVSAGKTGLGLTISKSIVESLGGEISVTSKYGKGTAITFVLPVYHKHEREEFGFG